MKGAQLPFFLVQLEYFQPTLVGYISLYRFDLISASCLQHELLPVGR